MLSSPISLVNDINNSDVKSLNQFHSEGKLIEVASISRIV